MLACRQMKNTKNNVEGPDVGARQRERPLRWRGSRASAARSASSAEAIDGGEAARLNREAKEAIARLQASRRGELYE